MTEQEGAFPTWMEVECDGHWRLCEWLSSSGLARGKGGHIWYEIAITQGWIRGGKKVFRHRADGSMFYRVELDSGDIFCVRDAAQAYWRAAALALVIVDSRRATPRTFGPEADAKWARLAGFMGSALRLALAVRDAGVEAGDALCAAHVFDLPRDVAVAPCFHVSPWPEPLYGTDPLPPSPCRIERAWAGGTWVLPEPDERWAQAFFATPPEVPQGAAEVLELVRQAWASVRLSDGPAAEMVRAARARHETALIALWHAAPAQSVPAARKGQASLFGGGG